MTGSEREHDAADAVVVPHGELTLDALQGLAEAFVLREGTEYGEQPYTLEQKVHHVIRQLELGEAVILCEPVSGSVDVVLKRKVGAKND